MKIRNLILGGLIGDIVGSVYEHDNVRDFNFQLFRNDSTFTDDSVLTIATMDAYLTGSSFTEVYQKYGRAHPHRGYGQHFYRWLHSDNPKPYNSWGNGSAMRVSPVGWAFEDRETVLASAKKSAEVSHNHPEGIKGAQAIAMAVFLARKGSSKAEIRSFIQEEFNYDLQRTISEIRPTYAFDVSCQGSVPEAIIAFLESNDYESALRIAISIGGDSDTIACMAGSIAEAFYGEIDRSVREKALSRLPEELKGIVHRFSEQYG